MNRWAKALLAPDKGANKRALQKEGEHPFHRERLPNHAARVAREVCPVGPELESHRNARNYSHGKIESEYLRPKPSGLVVLLFSGSIGIPFPVNNKPGKPHGELRKQVIIR